MEAYELVLLGKGQGEKPLGRLLLDHPSLTAVASVHGAVSQRHGTVPEDGGVRAPAPEQEGVQGAVGNQVDGRLFCVLEHVLQDARDAASQLSIILLSGQVQDDTQTHTGNVVPVDREVIRTQPYDSVPIWTEMKKGYITVQKYQVMLQSSHTYL